MLGPLMTDIDGTALSPDDRELLRHPAVGGVILFARNFVDPAQVCALIADIHALREPRLLVAVDQEGGRVQRFRTGFVELPPLAALGRIYDTDPEQALAAAAEHAFLMASELRAVDIDFSFAPVLDLLNNASSVIGDRALHRDPQVVARLARAYVRALGERGMAAVGKHFPGHGGVAEDSHVELPVDKREFDDIERRDLAPFRALVDGGIEGIMMAHVLYPKVDPVAAGYSRVWIEQTLRQEMRFEGVVFSDDLSMAGAQLEGSYGDRADLALAAGCDVLLSCNNREGAIEICERLGTSPYPTTQVRLMRLHGRGEAPDFASLQQSSRWQAAAQRFERDNRFPELELGDDNLHG